MFSAFNLMLETFSLTGSRLALQLSSRRLIQLKLSRIIDQFHFLTALLKSSPNFWPTYYNLSSRISFTKTSMALSKPELFSTAWHGHMSIWMLVTTHMMRSFWLNSILKKNLTWLSMRPSSRSFRLWALVINGLGGSRKSYHLLHLMSSWMESLGKSSNVKKAWDKVIHSRHFFCHHGRCPSIVYQSPHAA